MVKLRDILGLNARNLEYLRLNKGYGRRIADSKLLTKKILKKNNIPHPKLLVALKDSAQVEKFDWNSLQQGFVVKPSDGWGGEGIIVVKKPNKDVLGQWFLMNGNSINASDLRLHALDIIEGRYSRDKSPDKVIIEERVKIHPKFRKYAKGGTPDVRVIVFNGIPVMAMLRLPTKESNGKANLHQGAIGLGLDMATGITTYGVLHYEKIITRIPETGKKVNGLQVPFWKDVLKIAIDAQRVCKLGFVGIDLLIDEEKGPLIIELNDQPGLQIQMANQHGLLSRLRRVEDLELISPYKGIQIAEILFSERFSEKVKAKEGKPIIGIFEKIKLKNDKGEKVEMIAKVDTGAFRTSIDQQLADELGLLKDRHILWYKRYRSALGIQQRPVIELDFWLQGKKIKTAVNIAQRNGLRSRIVIGRRDLNNFIVDTSKIRNYAK